MTPNLEGKLFRKYPKIFNGALVGGHIKCGDGWYTLINCLCFNCQAHCDADSKIPQLQAFHIHEKLGMLHFLGIGGDQEIWSIIRRAETKSMQTCEKCGSKGEMNFKGAWLKCLCTDHKAVAEEPADTEV